MLRISLLTLRVSGLATVISSLIGVPLGTALSLWSFRGRRRVAGFVNAGMGLPPVVVGLWVSVFLWRTGPLGFLRLMYTPTAMVIAQTIIALPIVTGLTMAGVGQLDLVYVFRCFLLVHRHGNLCVSSCEKPNSLCLQQLWQGLVG